MAATKRRLAPRRCSAQLDELLDEEVGHLRQVEAGLAAGDPEHATRARRAFEALEQDLFETFVAALAEELAPAQPARSDPCARATPTSSSFPASAAPAPTIGKVSLGGQALDRAARRAEGLGPPAACRLARCHRGSRGRGCSGPSSSSPIALARSPSADIAAELGDRVKGGFLVAPPSLRCDRRDRRRSTRNLRTCRSRPCLSRACS